MHHTADSLRMTWQLLVVRCRLLGGNERVTRIRIGSQGTVVCANAGVCLVLVVCE